MLKGRNRIWLHVSTVSLMFSYLSTDLTLELDGILVDRCLFLTSSFCLSFHCESFITSKQRHLVVV